MTDRVIAVIAPDWDEARWADRLRAHGSHRAVAGPDIEPNEVRYAAVWMPPASALAGLPNLEVIFNLGAGVDHLIDDPDLPKVPIVRSVDPDLTQRMGEYVVLHSLLHTRRIPAFRAQQHRREWRQLQTPLASEVTVGIMGLGVLGLNAAAKVAAVGFQVAGWSRTEKPIAGVRCFAGPHGLAPFLAVTDILVSLLPATPETRGILSANLFSRLKRDGPLGGPILINAGRGALQVEADLIAALEDGTLAGASIDVFETEPLDPASPLWDLPNVVITPHTAADSDADAISACVMRQIAAYEAGGVAALDHVVDRSRGY